MKKCFCCLRALCAALVVVAFSVPLLSGGVAAQTSEQHTVQIITASDVGPFRPEESATLRKVTTDIVERTNAFRKEQEREALSGNEQLQKAAQEFAEYMARTGRYGHVADGQQPGARAQEAGYDLCTVAENIAFQFHTKGFSTEELSRLSMTGWKESPGHRENMLREHVTETGVGVAQSEKTGVYYLVQLFGRPRSQSIGFEVSNETESAVEYQVSDQKFTLPAHYARRHEMCEPSKLQLLSNGEPVESEIPKDGSHYAATQGPNGLTWQKKLPSGNGD